MTVAELKTVIETSTQEAVAENPALVYLKPYNEVLATAINAGLDAKLASLGLTPEVVAALLKLIPTPPAP